MRHIDRNVASCPQCCSLSVVPIVYGKPSEDLVQSMKAGLLALGGCIIENNSPTWHCNNCNSEWGDFQEDELHSNTIEYPEIVTIDFSAVDSSLREKRVFSIEPGMLVSDFLKAVYSCIKNSVSASSYGKQWMLRDSKTFRVFDVGSAWARATGSGYSRYIKEVRISSNALSVFSLADLPASHRCLRYSRKRTSSFLFFSTRCRERIY